MKQNNLLIATIVAVLAVGLVLAGYWLAVRDDKSSDQTDKPVVEKVNGGQDAVKFKAEYPEVAKDNRFVYLTADETVKMLESGTGIVLFGFPECPWCQKYVTYLDKLSRQQDLDKVHYFNVRQARADNTSQYQRMVELLGDALEKDDNGQPRIFVPLLVAVNDGKILESDDTTSQNTSADGTPDEWWTSARQSELEQEIIEMIREVKACSGSCNL